MTVYLILCNAFRNSIFERFHMSCADEIKSWNDPSCDISQFPATEKRGHDFSTWPCNPSAMLNPTNLSLFSFHHHFRFLENNNHPSKAIFPTSHNTVNKHQQIVRTMLNCQTTNILTLQTPWTGLWTQCLTSSL